MDSEALTSSQTLQLRPAAALDSLLLTPWSSSTLALSEPTAISTSTLPERTTVRVFALWRNDYAGQDPINDYDLNGESACSKGGWLSWTGICHPIRSAETAERGLGRVAHGLKSFFASLGPAFTNFGDVATGFIAGESACYIVGVFGAPETGGATLVLGAAVCAAGGTIEVHEIRVRLRRHRH